MQAITVPRPGDADSLVLTDVPDARPEHGQVLIEVAAAGVNHADLNQRRGHYPPPPGAPEWPGLEVSGTIVDLGSGDTGEWSLGDRVCALLPGGGYADLVAVATGHVLPVPDSVPLIDAAALPESIATTWSNLVMTAGLVAGETLLVHGGSSGIGTTAIQLGRALGCLVATTAGSARKLEACADLGAEILINYREEDFVRAVQRETDGRGADVILDAIGGAYVERDLRALAPHGRIVFIGDQSGEPGVLPVGLLLRSWASIFGTVLRARPTEEKTAIIASVRENVWPLVQNRQIVPVIDSRFGFSEAARAHERMESSEHIGKILLLPGS